MVEFTDKEIKKATKGTITDKGPGSIAGLSCVINENKKSFYLRYRIKQHSQPWRNIGQWAKETNKELNQFNVISIRERAQTIKIKGSQKIDYLKQEAPIINKLPSSLKDKLKEFFETILFEDEAAGLKLTWMSDRKRLTYMPERSGKDIVHKHRTTLRGKPEPKYKDWRLSQEQPNKYPAILDREHYWNYVGIYNNWIAGSSIRIKFKKNDKGTKLMNVEYNIIPEDIWPKLHKEITRARSKNVANDALEMLRVFYYWLINNKDNYIEENPIALAMSRKSTGPQKVRQEAGGTWHEIIRKDKEGLEDDQIDKLLGVIEEEFIKDPKSKEQRQRNRSLLFMLFRLVTGCRPDAAQYLKWEHLDNNKPKIRVLTKSNYPLIPIMAARDLVIARFKELKCKEPDHPFVFAGWAASGEQIGVKKITKIWKTVAKKAGIGKEERFYNLKHTAFSTIVKLTGDVLYAAKCCGISAKTAMEKYHLPAEVTFQEKIKKHYKPKMKLVVNNG